MTDEPAPSTTPAPPRRLDELSRLAALLADQVLNEQGVGQSIPEAYIRTLIDAEILLGHGDDLTI